VLTGKGGRAVCYLITALGKVFAIYSQRMVAFVEIHEVHWGNKWMGSSDLDELNNATSQTAGRGLKQNKTTNKTSGKVKQVKQDTLGCLALRLFYCANANVVS